jgi:signal peptide peptidase SppA
MQCLETLNGLWAILPQQLAPLQQLVLEHWPETVEAARGRQVNAPVSEIRVTPGGTAIIPVKGVTSKNPGLLTQLLGGASTRDITASFRSALSNPAVKSLILLIDSPGGTVDGTEELAETIFQGRGYGKPIVALADGMMASSAYWIGAAADMVFATGETATVGSIGVVARHVDLSKAHEQAGVTVTEMTAGRFKRVASVFAPLGEEGRQYLQNQLDYIYGVFVNAVARYRDLSLEADADGAIPWADGKVFTGSSTIRAGLVDGIATSLQLVTMIEENPAGFLARTKIARQIRKGTRTWN